MNVKPEDILRPLELDAQVTGAYGKTPIEAASGGTLTSYSPIDGEPIAGIAQAGPEDYEQIAGALQEKFLDWRMTPAPQRGEVIRLLANELRRYKEDLARLVTLETGKIHSEAAGEVQEAIDIADFAVGLSRQLYGLTMQSERPRHRMYEQWHPLGPIGIITAFNFPVAVWGWNAMIAAVCGDTMVWKPSRKAPLCAIAIQKICNRVMEQSGHPGVFCLAVGEDPVIGESMINDRRLPLISATGSCRMGRHVGQAVARRLGRSLLELGGNNAIIVEPDADLDLSLRAVAFGAVGTAGQRCTTTRRLYVHADVADSFTSSLVKAYESVRVGDPLEPETLMGPLIDEQAVEHMVQAVERAREQGGEVLTGGRRLDGPGFYVEPTLIRAHPEMEIVAEETFAPILYVIPYERLEDAIRMHNSVSQGLSSAIFTKSLLAAEQFLSHEGSDCGIANVNIGTSGAEVGGAFGGEKDTGGGREAGSDCWKSYMRRQTCTINWGREMPLAQGVRFDVG